MTVELGANYLLKQPIGRGAFGEVWLAVTRAGGTPLAVKLLKTELARDPVVVTRFLRERGILLRLDHPNVVRVVDLVVEGDKLGIVMEFVAGGDMRRYLDARGPLSPSQGCALIAQVADGLAAAHATGVVHRDLKPENVLMDTAYPNAPIPRITDFGIARIAEEPSLTRPSHVLGTPAYLSPVVASGQNATPASDVYAVGVMTYELLTGRPPFEADNVLALLVLHIEGTPTRPAGVPNALWPVVEACLAKDPLERPTATELADRLRPLALELGGVGPVGPSQPDPDARTLPPPGEDHDGVPRPPRRRWVVLLSVANVVLLAFSVVVLAVGQWSPRRPPRPPPALAAEAVSVAYDFDDDVRTDDRGVREVRDASGNGHASVVRSDPDQAGQITLIPHAGQGRAVRFPPPCMPGPDPCPRAIIQIEDAPDLRPGARDFTFGADVLVQSTEVSAGADIMQKGSATGVTPGVWKLELLADGRPRCGVVARDSGVEYTASSSVGISAGGWHRVQCTKTATALTIDVDGIRRATTVVPQGVVVDSDAPMRLGGHNIQQDTDQFFGALDNVFFRLRSP